MKPLTLKNPDVSPARVFYDHPSGVKVDLMPLYQAVGKEIDVEPVALRALAIVESDEKPFTPGGAPAVRLEVAYWKRNRYATKPALAFDKCTNSRDLDVRWAQFQAMHACQWEAAIRCHSFGMFQIMGFNHRACLCDTAEAFLAEMRTVEGQFRMLKHLILGSPDLLAALRRRDAARVALHYNGKAYAQNKYDARWAAATKAGGANAWA